MQRQPFVDRLLESENLTDQLEDAEADRLLKWGIAQIDGLIRDASSGEAAARIEHLMQVMRALNVLAGSPKEATPEGLADLVNRFGQLVGTPVRVQDDECRTILETLSAATPSRAVASLTAWLDAKRK